MSGEEPALDCCGFPYAPEIGDDVDAAHSTSFVMPSLAAPFQVHLVSRVQWGARPARSGVGRLQKTRGVKVHYTGSLVNPLLLDDHRRCAPAVRQIQNSHMDGNGWNDIGYSMICCPHRYVFEGRGPHRLPAANGPGLNTGHYAVCALVGNRGLTRPNDGVLHGIRDAITYLREYGAAGAEIRGHRDGYATDCPGDRLYEWVRRGAPRPSEEDDMPSAKEVAEAVWDQEIEASWVGSGGDRRWQAGTHIGVMHRHIRDLELRVAAMDDRHMAALAEIKALLAAQRPPEGT